MCLITISECKIAENDLYTIKLLDHYKNDHYSSPYRDSPYKLGKLKSAGIISKKHKIDVSLERGLHSFYRYDTDWFPYGLSSNARLIICKIPKGSSYYLGSRGDILSDKLIPLEIGVIPKYFEDKDTVFKKAFTKLRRNYGKQQY